jgi:hypothetical protein
LGGHFGIIVFHYQLFDITFFLSDSQTNSFINRVLSANGLSNVIPISSRKVERWDTWTNAKVVMAKPIILSWAMRLSIPILRDLRLNSVLFAPAPLLLPGRLSHIRHKNKQKSSFSANGFVNGIQVSFTDLRGIHFA